MTEDPFGTQPLFDLAPHEAGIAGERVKPARTVTWGNCPRCSNARAGLQRSGSHLTWRWHTYTTWKGTVLPCSASGLHLCDLPEPKPYYTPVEGPALCPHTRTQGIVA